ncbi:hypothetical protein Vadar_015423 [Vaccinium darrowii]|uniref:Uncharacterized protein n=1 Tax=Vaccinium darrowii TaxID=229202 RepID=A0ACB7X1G5_9ERIC|nr:hypothetical protein Vadar_015423 [Vaccinium darrowii]
MHPISEVAQLHTGMLNKLLKSESGKGFAGDVEPWADEAIRPYAERVRDCYASAFGLAAIMLGEEEAGVGYSGDVGGYVCCSCGLCS